MLDLILFLPVQLYQPDELEPLNPDKDQKGDQHYGYIANRRAEPLEKAAHTRQLGLKEVHIFWLYLLRMHPEGLSASQLAAAGKSDRSLVSREMDTLLEQGIVRTRESSGRRRYGWKLELTEKGEALAETISRVAIEVQDRVSRDIDRQELESFYKTLRILSANFEDLARELAQGEK